MRKVFITGGSGSIGQALTTHLSSKGYDVFWLSRKKSDRSFFWDPDKMIIDETALQDNSIIIHLAGNGVLDKRWSDQYKSEIISSRINGLRLLKQEITRLKLKNIHLISASGINYFGASDRGQILSETDLPGTDFISEVCQKWEATATELKTLVEHLSILRISVVFGKGMPAFEKILTPIKYGIGSKLGSGNQNIPWIHIEDLCRMFEHIIEQKLEGVYNAITDNNTQWEITKQLAKKMNKPLFLPPVPGFILKLILGERSILVLNGIKASNKVIRDSGFKFVRDQIPNSL